MIKNLNIVYESMTYDKIKPLKNKNKRVDQELLTRKSGPVYKKRAKQGKIIG